MQEISNFFNKLGGLVWGPYMLLLLVGTGVFLTVRLRGLQFRTLVYALKQAFGPQGRREDGSLDEGDISHFGALMTALSATIEQWNADCDALCDAMQTATFSPGGFQLNGGQLEQTEDGWTVTIDFTLRGIVSILEANS